MIRPTHARISTSALRQNYTEIRSRLDKSVRVMAVVKGNCYGHGIAICMPVLREMGVNVFGVATIGEARQLRNAGFDGRLVLLTTPFENERQDLVGLGLEPFVSDKETAEWLSGTAAAEGRTLQTHIYINTGMTRNGAAPGDALQLTELVAALPGLSLQGFCSHLATSESHNRSYAEEQTRIFNNAYREVRDAGFDFTDVHIANSGGILNFPEAHYTMVRPGLALYGYHPHPDEQEESGFRPVMSLVTSISSMRRVAPGTGVSYGLRYRTREETIIATLPIGYGDGLMRILSGKLEVLIKGKRYPVAGTICMDEMMVDLGPNPQVEVGTEVVVMGESGGDAITGWELAQLAETIPYEITTNISERVPRVSEDHIQSNIQDK